ncbi:hypothetical protein [Halobaculum sp. D14]|uniref:hypothetical protein n=1 Tax=unclassified Halobaculum TaxID=2640896 RepID=UPI003EBB433A
MTGDASGPAAVLVVAGTESARDRYAERLEQEYSVRTVGSGDEAVGRVASADRGLDVALVDRGTVDADAVAARIRAASEAVQVACVAGADADAAGVDVSALGAAADADAAATRTAAPRTTTTAAPDDLRGLVSELLLVGRYMARVRQYYDVVATRATRDGRGDADAGVDRAELARRRDELESELDELRCRLCPDDYDALFRGVGGPQSPSGQNFSSSPS